MPQSARVDGDRPFRTLHAAKVAEVVEERDAGGTGRAGFELDRLVPAPVAGRCRDSNFSPAIANDDRYHDASICGDCIVGSDVDREIVRAIGSQRRVENKRLAGLRDGDTAAIERELEDCGAKTIGRLDGRNELHFALQYFSRGELCHGGNNPLFPRCAESVADDEKLIRCGDRLVECLRQRATLCVMPVDKWRREFRLNGVRLSHGTARTRGSGSQKSRERRLPCAFLQSAAEAREVLANRTRENRAAALGPIEVRGAHDRAGDVAFSHRQRPLFHRCRDPERAEFFRGAGRPPLARRGPDIAVFHEIDGSLRICAVRGDTAAKIGDGLRDAQPAPARLRKHYRKQVAESFLGERRLAVRHPRNAGAEAARGPQVELYVLHPDVEQLEIRAILE